jgi:hypothetical protein
MRTDQTIEERITKDHEKIKNIYQSYIKTSNKNDCAKIYENFMLEMCRFIIAKELILYPMIKSYIPNGDVIIKDALQESKILKEKLYELSSLDIMTTNFDVKFRQLLGDIVEHFDKEQLEYIPQIIMYIPKKERVAGALKYESRKLIAPTNPKTMLSNRYGIIGTIQDILLTPIDKFIDIFKNISTSDVQ